MFLEASAAWRPQDAFTMFRKGWEYSSAGQRAAAHDEAPQAAGPALQSYLCHPEVTLEEPLKGSHNLTEKVPQGRPCNTGTCDQGGLCVIGSGDHVLSRDPDSHFPVLQASTDGNLGCRLLCKCGICCLCGKYFPGQGHLFAPFLPDWPLSLEQMPMAPWTEWLFGSPVESCAFLRNRPVKGHRERSARKGKCGTEAALLPCLLPSWRSL